MNMFLSKINDSFPMKTSSCLSRSCSFSYFQRLF